MAIIALRNLIAVTNVMVLIVLIWFTYTVL